MKQITIVLLIVVSNLWTSLQSQDLDKMNENTRQETLIKVAKTAVMEYGPDFYREYGQPEITHDYVGKIFRKEFTEEQHKKYKNRSYYTVKYFYDSTQEYLPYGYSSWVFIWAGIGKPFMVYFGHGFGLTIEDVEKLRKTSPSEAKKAIATWQKQPPGKFAPPKPVKVYQLDNGKFSYDNPQDTAGLNRPLRMVDPDTIGLSLDKRNNKP